jgi:membrane fusion protein, multidrug efflux system
MYYTVQYIESAKPAGREYRMKSPWFAALTALVAASLIAGCAREAPPVNAPRPVVVEAPQPLGGPAGAQSYPGAVRARVEADLSFRVPGKVAERRVDSGARVQRGTVLAVLDPEDAQLNLDAARASLQAAEADLWLAQEEERRYRDLKERGHVGQSAVDLRINTAKLAQAKLEQAKSQLNLAQNQSRYTRLTADSAGVVTQVFVEPGNVVAAGQPVLRFAADGEREVRIDVPEGRVATFGQPGPAAAQMFVEIFNQPGKRYAAKLREINPQADPATRTHEARVTVLDADDAVQLGATATVLLLDAGDGSTFRLPATALGALDKDRAAVWTVVAGPDGTQVVKPVPVKVMQYLEGAAIVAGALSAKDRLVTAGVHLLVEGMPVQPIDRAAKAAL